MLSGKSLLITGGTGSFGKRFVHSLFQRWPEIDRIVVFSRDEMKQFEMSQEFSQEQLRKIRFFIGDVRNKDRLRRALEGVDIVVHAAALKQVPAAEYNPFEFIKTNVLGAQNLIESCFDMNIEKVVALSTDKAAAPINLYGATKLCSDKLFTAANNMKGKRDIKLSVVRYGNVLGSRGSVIPYFLKKRKEGKIIPVTDRRMSRFSITLEQGVEVVNRTLNLMWGGEIIVPKIPSLKIIDLAKAIAPDNGIEIIGIRPGEKIDEEMITATDAPNTLEFKDHFAILPSMDFLDVEQMTKTYNGKRCEQGFEYNSGNNPWQLSVAEIRAMVQDFEKSNVS